MAWYAVSNDYRTDPDSQVWTVSKRRNQLGWDNDSDCEGYGLTRAEAEFLALAANEKEHRDGVQGPWTEHRVRVCHCVDWSDNLE